MKLELAKLLCERWLCEQGANIEWFRGALKPVLATVLGEDIGADVCWTMNRSTPICLLSRQSILSRTFSTSQLGISTQPLLTLLSGIFHTRKVEEKNPFFIALIVLLMDCAYAKSAKDTSSQSAASRSRALLLILTFLLLSLSLWVHC